jgi:hypothetical protein
LIEFFHRKSLVLAIWTLSCQKNPGSSPKSPVLGEKGLRKWEPGPRFSDQIVRLAPVTTVNSVNACLEENGGKCGGKKGIKTRRGVLQTEGIDGVDGTSDLAWSEMKTRG